MYSPILYLKEFNIFQIISSTLQQLNIMGRPSTKQRELKDGFYIEIRNKDSKTRVKIRRDNREQMLNAVEEYKKVKEVIVFGEFKNGKLITKSNT